MFNKLPTPKYENHHHTDLVGKEVGTSLAPNCQFRIFLIVIETNI